MSTFCLQPPGDTIPRAGIVDALSVACIPVLFHRAQTTLWPLHWRWQNASLLFDWSIAHRNASEVLQELLTMPSERVKALKRAARQAARSIYYRGAIGDPKKRDAVDILVDALLDGSGWNAAHTVHQTGRLSTVISGVGS